MGSRCPVTCFLCSTPPRAVGGGTQGLAAPGLHLLACHMEITGRIGRAGGLHPHPHELYCRVHREPIVRSPSLHCSEYTIVKASSKPCSLPSSPCPSQINLCTQLVH